MKKVLFLGTFLFYTFTAQACIETYKFTDVTFHEQEDRTATVRFNIISVANQEDTMIGATADWAEHIELKNGKGEAVREISFPASKEKLDSDDFYLAVSGIKEKLLAGSRKVISLSLKSGRTAYIDFIVKPVGFVNTVEFFISRIIMGNAPVQDKLNHQTKCIQNLHEVNNS